jgi:deoxycytidine triphosphate deaminase
MHVATGHVEGLVNISKADKVIWIDPGETILAHTQEFVGGDVSVTSMMKARSSMGRNFIEVCKVRVTQCSSTFVPPV